MFELVFPFKTVGEAVGLGFAWVSGGAVFDAVPQAAFVADDAELVGDVLFNLLVIHFNYNFK